MVIENSQKGIIMIDLSKVFKNAVINLYKKGVYTVDYAIIKASELADKNKINANDYDFYIVMNSMINDYNEVIDKDDIETYVKMSNAFINDEDAVKNKVWKYYTTIVKED